MFDRSGGRGVGVGRVGACAALGVLLATTSLSSSRAWAAGSESEAGDAGSAKVEEIVVTARKRAERAQDVPIAITAIAGRALRDGEHLRIEDLNQFAPSANIVIPSPHQTSFAIRGIGSNPGNDGLEQSAGLFLDGVYLGRPGMAATDLIDINQIELLRGPQGTLFGKNTTAGALNITTAAPSFTPQFTGQASFGNYDYRQFQGTVSGPLIGDVLAGRLTAYKTMREGPVRDVTTGTRLNGVDRQGVRGQLLYQPDDGFSVRLIGELHYEGDTNGATLINSMGATPAAFQAKLAAAGAAIAVDPDGLTTATNDPTLIKTRQAAISAEVNWKVGELTLTSITAYRNWFYSSYSDVDGSNKSILNAGYSVRDNQFSQELRAATPKGGRIEAVAGAYYFRQNLEMDQITQYGPQAASYLSGIPDALLPTYARFSPALATLMAYNNSRWDIWATPETRSYALFAQATWRIDPQWALTAGLRETYETKSERVWRPNPTNVFTGQPSAALAFATYPSTRVEISNWAPSGVLTLDYKPKPDVMVYATLSRGQKAGGVNATVPGPLGADSLKVRPEVATSFELGVKSQLFDKRLQLNVDLFDTGVDDYQATYIATPAGGGSSVQLLTNVGRVRTRGVEVEATAAPVAGLSLYVAASYNDANYASYPNAPCPAEAPAGQASCDLSGRPVAGAPRWIVNLGGAYEHDLGAGLQGFVGGSYSWRSSYYGYLDNSAFARVDAYGLLNLNLGVRSRTGWQVSVWGKNLLDEHYVGSYLNFGSLLPGVYVPYFGDPRTYGVTLWASF